MRVVRGGGQARRAQYLAALGIDLWTSRVQPAAVAPIGTVALGTVALAPASPVLSSLGWEALRAEVSECRRCGLCESRTQTVFGVGNTRSEVLVVGEAPGAEEDRQGEPFVGRAGQLLDSMLLALGRPRTTVYVANILKCRPPGNRDPSPAEVASCLPYLQRQIELLAPRLILVVGRIAAQSLLATDATVGRLRGQLHRYGPQGTPMLVTYHPAYLLRSPTEKRRVWMDLKVARAALARAGAAA